MANQQARKKELLTGLGFIPIEGTSLMRLGSLVETTDGEESYEDMEARLTAGEDVTGEPQTDEEQKEVVEEQYILETEQQYYAAEWIKNVPTPILYRLTVAGKRVYFEMGPDNEPIIYDGATNNIANGYVDSSGALENWKVRMRLEGKDPDAYANYRADFGTVMHYMYGLYLTGQRIRLSPSWIRRTVEAAKLRISKANMEAILSKDVDELVEDILSFAIFCQERNVRPVLIEKMLRSQRLGVASSVDAVVEMDSEPEVYEVERETGEVYKTGAKKGQPKMERVKIKSTRRIFAILDFKSGKNFYDEHALQLELYRRMIRENYGNVLKIEEIYNFAPGDPASKTAKYKLKRQTDNPILDMATVVYLQGKKRFAKTSHTVRTRRGEIVLGEEIDMGSVFVVETLKEYISRVMTQKEEV